MKLGPNTETKQTMGATIYNESTTTESSPTNGEQIKPLEQNRRLRMDSSLSHLVA